jgi:hypothetical protein
LAKESEVPHGLRNSGLEVTLLHFRSAGEGGGISQLNLSVDGPETYRYETKETNIYLLHAIQMGVPCSYVDNT